MDVGEMRLSEHPRATAGIRRAKGAAGLGVFALVALLSLRAGLPAGDAAIRGLLSGVVAYFLAWGTAVTVWRQIAMAELETARQRRQARLDSLAALEAEEAV
jgi:hypothetical protein